MPRGIFRLMTLMASELYVMLLPVTSGWFIGDLPLSDFTLKAAHDLGRTLARTGHFEMSYLRSGEVEKGMTDDASATARMAFPHASTWRCRMATKKLVPQAE